MNDCLPARAHAKVRELGDSQGRGNHGWRDSHSVFTHLRPGFHPLEGHAVHLFNTPSHKDCWAILRHAPGAYARSHELPACVPERGPERPPDKDRTSPEKQCGHGRGRARSAAMGTCARAPAGVPQRPLAPLSGTAATATTTATGGTSATGVPAVMAAPATRGVVRVVSAARTGTGVTAGDPPTAPGAGGGAAAGPLVPAVAGVLPVPLAGAAPRGHDHHHQQGDRHPHAQHDRRDSQDHCLTLLPSPEAWGYLPRPSGSGGASLRPRPVRREAALAGGRPRRRCGADALAPGGSKHS